MPSKSTITITLFTVLIIYIQNALSTTYYVDPEASPEGSGLSWTDAFTSLDSALTTATKAIDEIWLKAGFTYTPSNPSSRADCFISNLGLTIYGGFDGTETNIHQRNANNPSSIISGDIGTINDMTDNCYHVIQYQKTLTLDTVIIQHGNANYDGDYTTQNKMNAHHRYGGAIITTDVLQRTSLHLNNVIIRNNTAINGGALWFTGYASKNGIKVDVVIRDSKFEYNKAIDNEFEGGYGGAIYEMFRANITLIDTEFNYNEAIHRGGAIYQDYGASLYSKGCTFDYNSVQGRGGAIFTEDRNSQTSGTFPLIISSTFRMNTAGVDGGAIFWYCGVEGTLTDNVFISNSAPGEGTAVSLLDSESVSIGNVFEDNDEYSETTISYSDIDDNLVFDINKELTDMYDVWNTKQSEWDIYPFNPDDALCYVGYLDTNNDEYRSVRDGMSWDTAYTDIQQCLDLLSVNGGEIWVQSGVYIPTKIPQWKRDFGRRSKTYNTFEMYDDIRMYGGFDGTETTRDQRNWRDNPTYLSCQIMNNKNKQCIQILNTADDTLIDGFIFENAGSIQGNPHTTERRRLSADTANSISIEEVLDTNSDSMGAGVLSKGDTPHVVNSIFHKLYSRGKGGAIYCVGLEEIDGANKSPSFINVAFLGNRAQKRGGAISADVDCHFVCESCTFKNNEASGKGGGIYLDFDCDPTFIDTAFSNNYATESGGCIAADGQSLVTFNGSSDFTSNSAAMEGGCLYSGSGVNMMNEQGFVFQELPIFDNNYVSNPPGNGRHSDVYGWPFSTLDIRTDDSVNVAQAEFDVVNHISNNMIRDKNKYVDRSVHRITDVFHGKNVKQQFLSTLFSVILPLVVAVLSFAAGILMGECWFKNNNTVKNKSKVLDDLGDI